MKQRPIHWYLIRAAGLALLFSLKAKGAAVTTEAVEQLPAVVYQPPSDVIETRALQRSRFEERFDRASESLILSRMWR